MEDREEFIAEGYAFSNAADAKMAVTERKKVEYLEAHMDYSKPQDILKVYEKALRDRVFRTPVGISYLKHLEDFLLDQTDIGEHEIPPIPLYQAYETTLRDNPPPARQRIIPEEKGNRNRDRDRFRVSVIINIALAIAVLAMFGIAIKSEQPNILNYKRALTNQYAAWEQELSQREQAVREKERALGLTGSQAEDPKDVESDGQ